MNSPPLILKNFLESYADRKDILLLLQRAYIACIESDMTDDWNGQQRTAFFYLVEDIKDLILCLDKILPQLRPLLRDFVNQYEEETKNE